MIGKIVNIKESIIYVKLNVNVYDLENIIGKNITFNKRYIGEIVNMSDSLLEVFLIGEINNNVFIPGNIVMPPFGSSCTFTSKEELDIIYNTNSNENNIKIGKSCLYNDYNVCVNVNSFFSSHFAIFGNSGAGKSYFVASLLQKIYNSSNIAYYSNIFLFDAYGEYERAFENINSVNSNLHYRVFTTDINDDKHEKLIIPFWLLNVDDICLLLDVDNVNQISIIEKALKYVTYFSTSENDEILKQKNDIIARCLLDVIFSLNNHSEVRNKILTILSKFNTKDINLGINLTKGGWSRTIKQCLFVDKENNFADIESVISYLEELCSDDFELSLPDGSYAYSIKDFYNALEFALMSEGVFSSNKIFDYANILKIRLNSLINSDYVNYFKFNNYVNKEDFIKYLLIKNNNKYQIVNFNISFVDDRFAKVLVKVYSRILFDFVTILPNRATMPFHIILEEAHRYIQSDIDTKIIGYNIFERIAKEGRKYGILLGVISQRPSEISSTMVSQCSNFAIFKMFNADDISFVKSSIPNVNNVMINKIKLLSSGNCMLFGSAFKLPMLTCVDLPNPTPYSDSCNINNVWYVK